MKSIEPGVIAAAIFMSGGLLCTPSFALDLETGVDVFANPTTKIHSLHRLYAGHRITENFSFGPAFYSASTGNAGGAFFWGIEAVKKIPFSRGIKLTSSGFLGGGGGASEVKGDGTMYRGSAGLEFAITDRVDLSLGGSYVQILGSKVDDTAVTLGLNYHVSSNRQKNALIRVPIDRFSLSITQAYFSAAKNRSGAAQSDLRLLGSEITSLVHPNFEFLFSADGAISGGDGYMQVAAGARYRAQISTASIFAQSTLGFGGGGKVDTGGGTMTGLGIGVSYPVSNNLDFDLSYGTNKSLDSNISSAIVQARLTNILNRASPTQTHISARNMRYSVGLSQQIPNATYMKSGNNTGISPWMQESAIDLPLSDHIYVTGNAQTTVKGGVAGYAVGLIGLGYEHDIVENWTLSFEAHGGAAGGGGVDVGDGLVSSVRAEIDYKISRYSSISVAVGKFKSLNGGVDAAIFQFGLKTDISTR